MSAGRNKNNKTRLRKLQRKRARFRKGIRRVKLKERRSRARDNQRRLRDLNYKSFLNSGATARIVDGGKLACIDCAEPYGSPRFPDFLIDDDAWKAIAPNHDEGGLLCPNCICARLEAMGLERVGHEFRTGPFAGGAKSPDLNVLNAKRAAAPQLYDALRMLTDATIKLAPYPPEVSEAVVVIVDIAKAAIAKAEAKP